MAPWTTVRPLSARTRLALSTVSLLINGSTNAAFNSTSLIPAFAQPSRAPRYPAPLEVFEWMHSAILPFASAIPDASSTTGATSIERLDNIGGDVSAKRAKCHGVAQSAGRLGIDAWGFG